MRLNLQTHETTFVHTTGILMGQRHRGEFLKWLVETYKPNVNKLTSFLGIERSYIYKLYDEANVKWEYLRKAAEFVDYDITRDFPDIPIPRKQFVEESAAVYGSMTLSECLREKEKLKDKLLHAHERLYEVMDNNRKLMEEINRLQNKKSKNGSSFKES